MKKQRGFIPLIVLAGLLAFSGAVGYSIYNSTPQNQEYGRK